MNSDGSRTVFDPPELPRKQLVFAWVVLVVACASPHLGNYAKLGSLWWFKYFIQTLLPIVFVLYLSTSLPAVRQYAVQVCAKGLNRWYWILPFAVVWVLVETFAAYYGWLVAPDFFAMRDKAAMEGRPLPLSVLVAIDIYASLAAGVGEELLGKLLLLLCLPRGRARSGWLFVAASTTVALAGHTGFSAGGVLQLAMLYAIPTAIFFERTRSLGALMLFHSTMGLFGVAVKYL